MVETLRNRTGMPPTPYDRRSRDHADHVIAAALPSSKIAALTATGRGLDLRNALAAALDSATAQSPQTSTAESSINPAE